LFKKRHKRGGEVGAILKIEMVNDEMENFDEMVNEMRW